MDTPHHLRDYEFNNFRDGVVLYNMKGNGSVLDIGLEKVSIFDFFQYHNCDRRDMSRIILR